MKKMAIIFFLNSMLVFSYAQVSVQMSGATNKVCNGIGCNYEGPSILINEIMLSPASGNGSLYGNSPFGHAASGEWIELYNPDKCKSVDISCYFLGNYTTDQGGNYPAGFSIPPGTVVPPQGFAVIRGVRATPVPSHLLVANGGNTVEVIVDSRVCLGGGIRLWFPDEGGWFAFYDRNGVPQDAISWGTRDSVSMNGNPCNPLAAGCGYTGIIPNFVDIPADKKTRINEYPVSGGSSFRRLPDGGAWAIGEMAPPTLGRCNAICNPSIVVTCNGEATTVASGGTQPYTYLWDDGSAQTTATAIGLCAGIYCVTVTDALGITATGCYTVENHTPEVSHPEMGLCGNETTLELRGGTPAGGSYSGTGVNGTVFTTYDDSNVYLLSYKYSDNTGCTDVTEFSVTKYPVPQITFTYTDTICRGNAAMLRIYSATEDLSVTVSEGGSIVLESEVPANSSRSYEFYPEMTGSYSIEIANAGNCKNVYDFKTVVLNAPVIEFKGLTKIPEQLIGKTELSVDPGYISYRWNTGDTTNVIRIYEAGIYSVTVTNRFECTREGEIEIFIIPKDLPLYLPNAFIPSSDHNLNNCFFATGLEEYFDISVSVFNRWGQEVYQSNDPYFRWNGAMNGVPCPSGVYVWYIIYHDYFGKQYKKTGTVTLIR